MIRVQVESMELFVNGVLKGGWISDPVHAIRPAAPSTDQVLGNTFLSTDKFLFAITFSDGGIGGGVAGWTNNFDVMPETLRMLVSLTNFSDSQKRVCWVLDAETPFSYGRAELEFEIPQHEVVRPASQRSVASPLSFEGHFTLMPGGGLLATPMIGSVARFMHLAGQTAKDSLLQEYLDLKLQLDPAAIVHLKEKFNKSNYRDFGIGVDGGLEAKFDEVIGQYRNSTVVSSDLSTSVDFGGQIARIPADAGLVVTSAYRNPFRNVAIGSKVIGSKHTFGRALDLAPGPLPIMGLLEDGGSVELDLHAHVYPTLLRAARLVRSDAIVEDGAVPVSVGDQSEDHVHIQW